jgi:hypothetical protein
MTPIEPAKAVGYVRVSTEGQAADGVSLDAQRGRIEAWCRKRLQTHGLCTSMPGCPESGLTIGPGFR